MYIYARRTTREWRVMRVTDDGDLYTVNMLCKPRQLPEVINDTGRLAESTTWTRRDCMRLLMRYDDGDTFNVYDVARDNGVPVALAQAVCCVAAHYKILKEYGGRFTMAI